MGRGEPPEGSETALGELGPSLGAGMLCTCPSRENSTLTQGKEQTPNFNSRASGFQNALGTAMSSTHC